jgi:hypothetical protein
MNITCTPPRYTRVWKFHFSLMCSTNFDSALLNANCLLARQEWQGERSVDYWWVTMEECEGRWENLDQLRNLFCTPTIVTLWRDKETFSTVYLYVWFQTMKLFFKHDWHINCRVLVFWDMIPCSLMFQSNITPTSSGLKSKPSKKQTEWAAWRKLSSDIGPEKNPKKIQRGKEMSNRVMFAKVVR